MKPPLRKKIQITLSVAGSLIFVLVLHVYTVTRRLPPSSSTRAMARVDFHNHLSKAAADTVTDWLYHQPGVDHVLCNSTSGIAVFTYYPAKADADKIIADMQNSLHYATQRFMPSKADMEKGCPMASGSFSTKIKMLFSSL